MDGMKADAIDATVTVIIDVEIDETIDGTMIMKDLTMKRMYLLLLLAKFQNP